MKFFKIILFFFFTFYISYAKADTGCLIGSTLYTGNNPTHSFLDDLTFTNTTIVLVTCPVNDKTSMHAINLKEIPTWFFGAKSLCRITPNGIYDGVSQTYDLVQCPIDDYIPYMLLGVSVLGFVYIRKRNLLVSL